MAGEPLWLKVSHIPPGDAVSLRKALRAAHVAGQEEMRERIRDACDECREVIDMIPVEPGEPKP